MSIQDPLATTLGDLCTEALKECGAWGMGMTPLAEDINGAAFRLQAMLQQWQRKRWLVYHLVDLSITSTGQRSTIDAQPYTVGPGGQIATGTGSTRPDRVERGYLRQLTQSLPNQIDYPLELFQSMEDYVNIALKSLGSFPTSIYYDPAWPLGKLAVYPVPLANIYAIHILVREQLPQNFAPSAGNTWLTTRFNIPFEYYAAMLYNLALRLRPKYQLPSWPGDPLPGLAKDALNVLRGANTQIARLTVAPGLGRSGIYNIFNDRSY